jgi:Ca2+-dependent lipid-binding protein, contains C2 domain
MSVPVSVTALSIPGRLLVGFRLANRSPGVCGVDLSFVDQPGIHVAIQPAGFAVSGLPGVPAWVSGPLAGVFAPSSVAPGGSSYGFGDASLRSLDGSIAAASGPGGALVVGVASAQRLPATNKESP